MKPFSDKVGDTYWKGIKFCVKKLFSQDRNGNCQPGTTIDQEVCHPTLFDYYQFGHAGIQVFFCLFVLVSLVTSQI